MNQILTIWKKEIKDTLRDRRTLMAMIIIPILLMPLLIIGMSKFLEYQIKNSRQQTVKVAVAGGKYAPDFIDILKKQDKIELSEAENIKNLVESDKLDAGIIIPPDFNENIKNLKPVQLKIIIKSTSEKSSSAMLKIDIAAADFNESLLEKRFAEQKINPGILSKISPAPEDVATEKERGGFGLGFLLPFLIVIWTVTGGQYTAIDVSAGEKERKTLEALLLTSASRLDIVFGKFLAVATTAAVSVIAAISSIYLSISFFGFGPIGSGGQFQSGASQSSTGSLQSIMFDFSLDPKAAALLLAVSLLLIFLFSAVMLSIAIFAKSFKEAQNYLGSAYIFVILPIVLTNTMIGFKPELWYFAIPAVNAVLLFKEILIGAYDFWHILTTMLSLTVYSLIAIFIAMKIYSKENVLLGD